MSIAGYLGINRHFVFTIYAVFVRMMIGVLVLISACCVPRLVFCVFQEPSFLRWHTIKVQSIPSNSFLLLVWNECSLA